MSAPVLVAVVGPNGSGKSSALYETQVADDLLFINPDDIARRDFSHVADRAERDLLAWQACNAQRDALLAARMPFGFETVGSHPSKAELLERAKALGHTVVLLFVATEDPEINIGRIAARQAKGGHGVPDDKVRSRYWRTLGLLGRFFDAADYATVWDNSEECEGGAIVELVRKSPGAGVEVLPGAWDVAWAREHLLRHL